MGTRAAVPCSCSAMRAPNLWFGQLERLVARLRCSRERAPGQRARTSSGKRRRRWFKSGGGYTLTANPHRASAPQDLAATGQNSAVALTWSQPASTGGATTPTTCTAAPAPAENGSVRTMHGMYGFAAVRVTAPLPDFSPDPPGSSWSTMKRLHDTGSLRTPSRLAHQARLVR